MPRKKANREIGRATLASVRKEMAKPRVAKSARAVRRGQAHEPRLGRKEIV